MQSSESLPQSFAPETITVPKPESGEEVIRVENQKQTDVEIDIEVARVERTKEDNQRLVALRRSLGEDPYASRGPIEGNFKGDWTLLLRERLKHPATKEKFIGAKAGLIRSGIPYEGTDILSKKEFTKKYHYDQIRDYDKTVDAAFTSTTTIPAREAGHEPAALGSKAEKGTVFSDAALDGRPLTIPEKNAVESHEKGHAVRDFKANFDDIMKGFDLSKISEMKGNPNYLRTPDELIERMSQLKNYFGFRGDETFTRGHLASARQNYVNDGALNNSMGEFLSMVTPEKEDEFLRVMNEYPI